MIKKILVLALSFVFLLCVTSGCGANDNECDSIREIITITFSKDYIYNKKNEKETFLDSEKLMISVPKTIYLSNKSDLTLEEIQEFTLVGGGVRKQYMQLGWVYVDDGGELHKVASCVFDKENFDNKTEIVLYMQYLEKDVWLDKNY